MELPPELALLIRTLSEAKLARLEDLLRAWPFKPGKTGTMTHLCTSPAGQELS
jgi:hypothetical protein